MKIKVTPSAIAPIVRGLVLSRASFSCMVKTRPESFACPGERTNESADGPIDRRPEERAEEHIRLVLDGILPQSEIEDAELAQALQHSLTQPQAQAIRRQLRIGDVCLDIMGAAGASIALLDLVPLEPLDRRYQMMVQSPSDASLLSSASRASVVRGKIALVTGGAQGFGAEIARGLAHSGAVVWIADINLPAAQSFAQTLSSETGTPSAFAIDIDVSSEASVQRAFETISLTTGGLDLVISNAGILKAGSLLTQPVQEFRLVNEVNYVGFFNIAQHAARLLRLQWLGAPDWFTDIIQINSKSGLQGSNKNSAYAGSKFGSIGLVQSFALELVEYRIKVNAICPGNFFDGPLWSDPQRGLFVQYLNSGKVPGARTIEDVRAFYESKVPMGRGCYGPDVLKAIYYLVEQVYETGQALPVTGGQVMLN